MRAYGKRGLVVAVVLAVLASVASAQESGVGGGYLVRLKWSAADGIAREYLRVPVGPFTYGPGKQFTTKADASRASYLAALATQSTINRVLSTLAEQGQPIGNVGGHIEPVR